MIVAVLDGQDGSIGSRIIEKIRDGLPEGWEILALGTNATATAAMLKAGAEQGATGEGAVVWNSLRCAAIAGTLGAVLANSMMGELTPRMAEAVASSPAEKFLLPVNDAGVTLAGVKERDFAALLDDLAGKLTSWAADPL